MAERGESRQRLRRALLATLAGALALAPSADAAREWADPVRISAPDADAWIGKPVSSMAFTAKEDAVMAWKETGPRGSTINATVKPKVGVAGQPQVLGGGYNAPTVASLGAAGGIVTWVGKAGAAGPGESVLVSEVGADGVFGPAKAIARTDGFYIQPGAAVAANLAGEAIVVYSEGGDGANRVMLVRRSVTGEWSEPRPLSAPLGANVWRLDAKMADSGEAVVAWYGWYPDKGRRAWSAVVAADGSAAQPRRMNEGPQGGAPKIAMDRAGNAAITWPEVPAGGWAGPVRAAVKGPGQPFGESIALGGSTTDDDGAEVGLGAGGQAVVAWASATQTSDTGGYVDGIEVVAGSVLTGRFGPVRDVSDGLASDPVQLAVDPFGNAAVFFRDWDTFEQRVVRRSAAGRVGQQRAVVPCGGRATQTWPGASHVDALGDASLLWVESNYLKENVQLHLSQDRPSASFGPDPCPQPPPWLTWTPRQPQPGDVVRFDGSGAIRPEAVSTDFSWDLDNDGDFELGPTEDPYAERRFATAGEHKVGYRVHYESGRGSSSTSTSTYTVRVGLPPEPAEDSSDPYGWDPPPPDLPAEDPWPFGPGPPEPIFPPAGWTPASTPGVPVYVPPLLTNGTRAPLRPATAARPSAALALSLDAPARRSRAAILRQGLPVAVTAGATGTVRLALRPVTSRAAQGRPVASASLRVRRGQARLVTLRIRRSARRLMRSRSVRAVVLEVRGPGGATTRQRVRLTR